jgi:hypothetical protein
MSEPRDETLEPWRRCWCHRMSVVAALALGGAGTAGAQPSPNGGEFQVNTYTTNDQRVPAVAVDGQGNFVVAWQSYSSSGTDTSYSSIQAQRYDALFRDGFESGTTGRWSQ